MFSLGLFLIGSYFEREIRNFLNPLSRVEIFEYAMNPESCCHQIRIFFYPVT